MSRGQTSLLDPIRRLLDRQGGSALADAELLDRYVSQREPAAFEVLVWRHGTMVLSLCKRILRDEHEAEDAFQATFLVFARKAASVGRSESLGCWLYKVAYRVALRLRTAATKRPATGEAVAEPVAPEQPDDLAWRDLSPVLDEEIAGLPEKYREPFVLCYLQGRTNEEAAAQLGCPKGTILSRLSRARDRLRARLSRRGLAPTAVALAMSLPSTASAALPPALIQSTTAAALPFAAGTAIGIVPAHIAALAEGVLRVMIVTKLKTVAAGLVALAVLGTGVVWARGDAADERGRPAAVPASEGTAPQERGALSDRGAPEGSLPPRDVKPAFNGRVASVAKDGKSITLEMAPTERGGEPGKQAIQLNGKTGVMYNGVGANGATPTEGYAAVVWLADGSKDTASFVVFNGTQGAGRGADVVGVISVVGKDGKSITIDVPPGRDAERGAEPKKVTIPFDAKTTLMFSNIAKGGASLGTGQRAMVWYVDESKTAGVVHIWGEGEVGRRDEKRPELMGKVLASTDGKSITLEVPPAERGGEFTKSEVKLTDKSSVLFQNVGLDGAKVTEGMRAMVWLADNSKDTAAKVYLLGTVPERWTTVSGKITAVGKDGSSFTVEIPAANPRTEEPRKLEVKFTAKTQLIFNGVGSGEAKVAEGMFANARLLDGSKDTAAQVTFSKGMGRR